MTESLELLLSVFRFAAPLMLVSMGGLMSERSGVVNIALEGFILFGAFFAAAVVSFTGNPWLGLGAGALAGGIAGLFYSFLSVGLKSDQIVSGTAINMLAWGGIPFIGKILFDSTANTPALELAQRLPTWLPIVVATLIVILLHLVISKTAIGLWLTFAGEKPQALTAVGINPTNVRWIAVAMSGVLAGCGGSMLSIALSSSYTRNMSAGRGFMALAALILGKWRVMPTAAACVLFGVSEVLQLRLQGVEFPLLGELPVQLVQVLPYALTLVILAGLMGESRAPASLGSP